MGEVDTIDLIINDIEYVIKNNVNITKLNIKENEFLFNKLNELLIRINIMNWHFIDKLEEYNNINININNKSSNMGICSYKILIDVDGWELRGDGDGCGCCQKGFELCNEEEKEPFIIELVGKVMPESYILSCNYLFSQKEFINSFIKSIILIVELRNEVKSILIESSK
jgi:hypothetical protein